MHPRHCPASRLISSFWGCRSSRSRWRRFARAAWAGRHCRRSRSAARRVGQSRGGVCAIPVVLEWAVSSYPWLLEWPGRSAVDDPPDTRGQNCEPEVGFCSVGSNRKAGASRGRFVAVRRHPQEEPASPSSAEDALRLGCRSAVSASTWTAAALAIPSESDSATNADDRAVAVRLIREN